MRVWRLYRDLILRVIFNERPFRTNPSNYTLRKVTSKLLALYVYDDDVRNHMKRLSLHRTLRALEARGYIRIVEWRGRRGGRRTVWLVTEGVLG